MKKTLIGIGMIAAWAAGHAQISGPPYVLVTTAPSGSCSNGQLDQQIISTGVRWSCQNGAWAVFAPGAGGPPTGAAGGQLSGTYPNPSVSAAPWSGLIAGTNPNSGTFTQQQTGIWTNTQMNETFLETLNGCNPQTIFQDEQTPSSYATDALTGCLIVPSSSSVLQADALAGYASSGTNTVVNVVASSGQSICGANGCNIWGGNTTANDMGFAATQVYGDEIDVNVANAGTHAEGLRIFAVMNAQPSIDGTYLTGGNAPAMRIVAPYGGHYFTAGYTCDTATIISTGTCFLFAPLNAGTSQPSQREIFVGMNGSGTHTASVIQQTAQGTLMVQGSPFQSYNAETVSQLTAQATCSSLTEGAMNPVTDATSNTAGSVLAGGGAYHDLAYCDGTNWIVGIGGEIARSYASIQCSASSGGACTTSAVPSGAAAVVGVFESVTGAGSAALSLAVTGATYGAVTTGVAGIDWGSNQNYTQVFVVSDLVGTPSFTATCTGANCSGTPAIHATIYRGVSTSSPQDGSGTSVAATETGSFSCSAITTSNSPDLLVAFGVVAGSSTLSAGSTPQAMTNVEAWGTNAGTEYATVAATGSNNAGFNFTGTFPTYCGLIALH
jgi:hypothetical protein